jgi:hypothetical protein
MDGNDDAGSDTTATSGTATHTPPASVLSINEDRTRYRPLSHGKKFLIIERLSGKAIAAINNGGLRLQDVHAAERAEIQWLCIEEKGYFGLMNSKSGKYIGHDGNGSMQALVGQFNAWECITTRDLPSGGYKLLVPHWWNTLRTVVVAEDGRKLVIRDHGDTLWDFIEVLLG